MGGIITGTWSDIKLVCTYRHEEPIAMNIKEGPASPFYACPKYYDFNREPDERACNNRLNLVDYEKMITHIDKIRYDAEMSGEMAILTGYTWKTTKGIEYKILQHKHNNLVVGVTNKVAINK